ncbi:MAG: 50S ribosomal protein L11 methyltransferase [Vicinamibacterales bacterium]
MSRSFPALDVSWGLRPDDDAVDRILAEIDDERATAWERHEESIRIFFVSAAARHRAAIRLTAFDAGLTCTPVDVDDEDWAERSQVSLGPVSVGRIVVAPPWRKADAAQSAPAGVASPIVILIQPSMGFGTGHHASTRLCLDLLQRRDPAGARVLDVGTGSGVLALAAWRLGAGEVEALDSDPDALHSAAENLALNAATNAVRLRLADLSAGPGTLASLGHFDLVLANLTGAVLERHAAVLLGLLTPAGALIASGLETDEEPRVRQAFEASQGVIRDRADEGGWVALGVTSPTGSIAR